MLVLLFWSMLLLLLMMLIMIQFVLSYPIDSIFIDSNLGKYPSFKIVYYQVP